MSAAELHIPGAASCSRTFRGGVGALPPLMLPWRPRLQPQQPPQAAPQHPWWRTQRSTLLQPRAKNSLGDIGDDLREIKDDLVERISSTFGVGARGKAGGGGGPAGSGGPSSSSSGGSGGGGSPDQQPPRRNTWTEWSNAGIDEDWDSWSGSVVPDLDDEEDVAELREQIIERRRLRQGKRSRVRDEYLRPIVDAQGIYNRLTYDEREAEERVFVEAITNKYESKEALAYAGYLVAVPLVVGFVVSRAVAAPLWDFAETINPAVFDLSEEQKIEGAQEVKMEEVRMRMAISIGRAPPLNDQEMLIHLAKEAHHIADEMREGNKHALLNVVSDSTTAMVFFLMLLRNTVKRQILFRTIGRVFSGLSDTAKAFLIILITDILLGYHSEEGWTAFLRIASRHYGVEPEMEGIYIFVSTVPVFLDTCFKYWIFVGLNKEDPAAAVTLKQMDRH